MPSNLSPLSSGPEFDKIRTIWKALGKNAVGGGDDCAFVEFGDELVAISTDMAVAGTHFRSEWLGPKEIGWRAGAAALSDLAAVAASPMGMLVSLGLPAAIPDTDVASIMEGVGNVCASVGAKVWGGDLVRSERIVIDVVVFGTVSEPLRRSGASPGDTIWVTGKLGGPAEALKTWESGSRPDRKVRSRFAKPVPRVEEAIWLRDHGATALIDLSDGLIADAGHLSAASHVALVLDAAKVPIFPSTDENSALLGGEEYELLVSLPSDTIPDLGKEFESKFDLPLTGIGHIESGKGVRVLKAGVPLVLENGFSHF